MIGKSLSHCRIIEKLGRGGMGEGFPPNDTSASVCWCFDHKARLPASPNNQILLPESISEIVLLSPNATTGISRPRTVEDA